MTFSECMQTQDRILMEGALGERLKREYRLTFDAQIAMAALVESDTGATALRALWGQYLGIAQKYGLPFLATTPTRRANKERMAAAGRSGSLLAENVRFLRSMQQESDAAFYVGGLMGCKGDAYTGASALSEAEAHDFHSWQAGFFRDAGADFLFAGIMPNLPEAAGMAQAMADAGIPYIISFTVQRNGTLIDGTPIYDAIQYIDHAAAVKPVCYMTNCVHPTILYEALSQPFNQNALVRDRFWGIQANTSPLSYAELDGAADLKCSDPEVFAQHMLRLREVFKLKIFGGCCGTDNRHLEQVAQKL